MTSFTAITGDYRSYTQSPRPGGPAIRLDPGAPPTPDGPAPPRIWDQKLGADGGLVTSVQRGGSRSTSGRRQSFLKYLRDHPDVAAKRVQRLADGTQQTTIQSASSNGASSFSESSAATSFGETPQLSLPTESSLRASIYNSLYERRVAESSSSSQQIRREPAGCFSVPVASVSSTAAHPGTAQARNIFEEMDANHDGMISWQEFLLYLNQSEARNGVYQVGSRRSSLGRGMNATTKVQRRLALRRFFNTLDVNSDGSVTLAELTKALDQNPEIASFFDTNSLHAIRDHQSTNLW